MENFWPENNNQADNSISNAFPRNASSADAAWSGRPHQYPYSSFIDASQRQQLDSGSLQPKSKIKSENHKISNTTSIASNSDAGLFNETKKEGKLKVASKTSGDEKDISNIPQKKKQNVKIGKSKDSTDFSMPLSEYDIVPEDMMLSRSNNTIISSSNRKGGVKNKSVSAKVIDTRKQKLKIVDKSKKSSNSSSVFTWDEQQERLPSFDGHIAPQSTKGFSKGVSNKSHSISQMPPSRDFVAGNPQLPYFNSHSDLAQSSNSALSSQLFAQSLQQGVGGGGPSLSRMIPKNERYLPYGFDGDNFGTYRRPNPTGNSMGPVIGHHNYQFSNYSQYPQQQNREFSIYNVGGGGARPPLGGSQYIMEKSGYQHSVQGPGAGGYLGPTDPEDCDEGVGGVQPMFFSKKQFYQQHLRQQEIHMNLQNNSASVGGQGRRFASSYVPNQMPNQRFSDSSSAFNPNSNSSFFDQGGYSGGFGYDHRNRLGNLQPPGVTNFNPSVDKKAVYMDSNKLSRDSMFGSSYCSSDYGSEGDTIISQQNSNFSNSYAMSSGSQSLSRDYQSVNSSIMSPSRSLPSIDSTSMDGSNSGPVNNSDYRKSHFDVSNSSFIDKSSFLNVCQMVMDYCRCKNFQPKTEIML